MSDSSVGGFSTAQLTQMPANPSTTPETPAHVLFHGKISTKLPANRPDVQRTGYAAWRNMDRGRSLFGQLWWNVDPYVYLALRVKSDGRKYFVNIQTDSIVETDIHQHRLYTKYHRGAGGPDDPGSWETVLIKLIEFVRTNHGVVTEPQSEMLRQKVKSVGIGLIDRMPGDFSIGIGAVWATNLNERGQVDGRTKWEEGDQGSARLSEVTEEKASLFLSSGQTATASQDLSTTIDPFEYRRFEVFANGILQMQAKADSRANMPPTGRKR